LSVRLAIRVQPGAKSNEIVGWVAGENGREVLKIRLRAPAVEGKANAALIEFLAEILGLRPRQITLERGDKSRDKLVQVEGMTSDEIRTRTAGKKS
jgi:uncharacterized protein (TIGR00251 family)